MTFPGGSLRPWFISWRSPRRRQLRELPEPRPHADEVLVRVRAAGVNPVDWKIRQGQLRFILGLNFPSGGDIAGKVISTGPEVTEFKAGDPVVGFGFETRGRLCRIGRRKEIRRGKSLLLVSTDPASNLDEILDVPLGNLPVAVPGAERAA